MPRRNTFTHSGHGVSRIRNAAREYANAYRRWIKVPVGSEREAKLYRQMEDRIIKLSREVKASDAPNPEQTTAIAQGLSSNRDAADFLANVFSDRGA